MILILDFGSQYSQLIARRVREAHVYCELHPFDLPLERIRALRPAGIILSGGPASVYEADAPHPDPRIGALGIPLLGICYGMGVLVQEDGGRMTRAAAREFGPAELVVDDAEDLLAGFAAGHKTPVWMSHGDRLEQLPPGWTALAHSDNSPVAACADRARRRYAIQFHPEVVHTPRGRELL
ncbi:MAG: glutamine-hydrolyzing GMP synthase, partial [Candidatus Binatia bacterium]